MVEWLGLAQLSLLAATSVTLIASLASRLVYSIFRERLAVLPPSERATALFSWLVAPAALGPLVTAACFLPSFLAAAIPGTGSADHCLAHHDHHAHFCFLHPPADPGSLIGWALIAVLSVLGVGVMLNFWLRIRSSQAAVGSLLAAAEHDSKSDLHWISSSAPIAILTGILRPQLIVSKSLRDGLTPAELRAVVLHERAHARRRDVMRIAAASFLSLLHLPSIRKTLLRDFRLACEQAADSEAATVIGDPLCVAEAILKVGRLSLGALPQFGHLGTAFGEGDLEERIHALLSPIRHHAPTLLRGRMLLAAALCLFLIGSGPLHHLIETALAPLTH